jgi:hypothetical protein
MESALGLALEIEPENREALKFLAKTNLENNRVRDAGRVYARLLEKKGDDVETMLSLGLCFYRGGDIESAKMHGSGEHCSDPKHSPFSRRSIPCACGAGKVHRQDQAVAESCTGGIWFAELSRRSRSIKERFGTVA